MGTRTRQPYEDDWEALTRGKSKPEAKSAPPSSTRSASGNVPYGTLGERLAAEVGPEEDFIAAHRSVQDRFSGKGRRAGEDIYSRMLYEKAVRDAMARQQQSEKDAARPAAAAAGPAAPAAPAPAPAAPAVVPAAPAAPAPAPAAPVPAPAAPAAVPAAAPAAPAAKAEAPFEKKTMAHNGFVVTVNDRATYDRLSGKGYKEALAPLETNGDISQAQPSSAPQGVSWTRKDGTTGVIKNAPMASASQGGVRLTTPLHMDDSYALYTPETDSTSLWGELAAEHREAFLDAQARQSAREREAFEAEWRAEVESEKRSMEDTWRRRPSLSPQPLSKLPADIDLGMGPLPLAAPGLVRGETAPRGPAEIPALLPPEWRRAGTALVRPKK